MRTTPLRPLLQERGARFEERGGVELVTGFSDYRREYDAVRTGVGLTDFSFTTRYRIPEDGLDLLDKYAAGPVPNIRFGRVLHTIALSEAGEIESDLLIANDDEHFIVIGENLISDEQVESKLDDLGGRDAGLENLSESTALIGVDGYNAWAVAKELFGTDVLGLPYLSLENYELDGIEVKLIRAGKTSEFGYLLMVDAEAATAVWERIERAGASFGIAPVGLDTHFGLRLDGRFFNLFAEGAAVRDPLPLGLQWMIDLDGEDFIGKEAVAQRRAQGLGQKIIGVVPSDAKAALTVGETLVHGGREIAKIIAATDSPTLGHPIGLALFDIELAYAGLEFEDGQGRSVKTISMPPFLAKSLTVKLDEM